MSPELSQGHRRLLALAGAWRGEEVMSATQWAPAGAATAEAVAEAEFGGLFVSQRYVQTRDGKRSFAAHNVFGFDAADGMTKMFQFDSAGYFPAGPATGRWEGEALVLERVSPRGSARATYAFEGADRYRSVLEFKPAGADAWQPMTNGRFERVASLSINIS